MCPPSQNFGVGLKKTAPGASKSSASVAGGKFQGANGRLLEWAVSAPKITRPPRKCILRAQFQSNCWRCPKQPTVPKKKKMKPTITCSFIGTSPLGGRSSMIKTISNSKLIATQTENAWAMVTNQTEKCFIHDEIDRIYVIHLRDIYILVRLDITVLYIFFQL
jgi:hypothetical protein